MNRRHFLTTAGAGALAAGCNPDDAATQAPSYLRGYESEYERNPKQAAVQWFREAKFGLFIHYGLYSLLGRGEWIQYDDLIPIKEYEKLAQQFTATAFDAAALCDLAISAGMKYVNLVSKHCDSFALWPTAQSDFHVMNSAVKRDLVGEMAGACRERGLGFFAFYEHGFDWRHPHGPAPWLFKARPARPAYDPPDPWYASREEHDFNKYVEYANAQITELLTGYGPIAGLWLDGIGIPLSGDPALYRCDELYPMIRRLQPQTLISYKYGLTGDEDFFAPEDDQLTHMADKSRAGKPLEVCTCLQVRGEGATRRYHQWGYNTESVHKTPDQVWQDLAMANNLGANLLLNIGPLPDGSVHPEDLDTLHAVGKRIRAEGFPAG
ncbi:MAG: alpha-L-fucosidase [bacterium]|nr:alpha-L-fucosidase [bacterium]